MSVVVVVQLQLAFELTLLSLCCSPVSFVASDYLGLQQTRLHVQEEAMQVRFEVDAAPLLLVKRTVPLPQPALDYVEATMRMPKAHESWKVRLCCHPCC